MPTALLVGAEPVSPPSDPVDDQVERLAARVEELERALAERAVRLRETRRELGEAEATLEATRDRLVRADELASVGQLTAGVAHEIKNPLSFVKNFAAISAQLTAELADALRQLEVSSEDVGGDDVFELLQELETATNRVVEHGMRADDIVNGMMLRARNGPAEPEPVDLNRLLDECCDLAAHGLPAVSGGVLVAVERAFAPAVPVTVLDVQAISRVLINLLNNAFDAVHQRADFEAADFTPTLWVSTRLLDGLIELRIRDNGGGVAPEALESIFEPFFTTKPAGRGTGLGLSMSREVVEDQGGTIRVESVPGEGAEFILTLPAKVR